MKHQKFQTILSRPALATSCILFALQFSLIANAVIIPSELKEVPGQDPLNNYQYWLQYSGQRILRDITDITSVEAILDPLHPVDIGVPYNSSLDNMMKKDIVVAVLDSGIDLKHPDIISSLYHNSLECNADGSIPFLPTEDKDKNGYIGDCTGWNFASANPKAKNNNRPEDDLGHGTHVAGLIAASRINGIGIAGVSNRIKILPLKVTSAKDKQLKLNQPPPPDSGPALNERILKAIQYATSMKVDVINMSIGWPSAYDTPAVRMAIKEALDAGITIVAAAGNNDTSMHVFPCSYAGVICVGATGIDNKLTDFSNFGGAIDISAPGEEILSLFPSSLTAENFSGQQYEIKSGTSQAAPLVSASVAILKGIFPGINEDEIKARLMLSSQNLGQDPENRFIQFGTLKLKDAISVQPQALTVPIFKNLDLIRFTINNPSIQFTLPIKNYWIEDSNIKISITSLSPQLQIQASETLSSLASGATQDLIIHGTLLDSKASSEVSIQVTISSPNQNTRVFTHNLQLTRIIDQDPGLIRVPILSKASLNSKLTDFYDLNKAPEYYRLEMLPNLANVYITRLINGQYIEDQTPIQLNGAIQDNRFINVLKLPLLNEEVGYMISALFNAADGKGRILKYFYFDKDLQPSQIPSISFAPETSFIDNSNYSNLNFIPMEVSLVNPSTKNAAQKKSTFRIPVFINNGKIPKADLNPDSFQFEANNETLRIYFLEPKFENGSWLYATHEFDNYKMTKKLRKDLSLQFKDDLVLVGFLPQQANQTTIRLLYGYGRSDYHQFVIISADAQQIMNHDYTIVGNTGYTSTQLDKGSQKFIIDIAGNEASKTSGSSFVSFVTPTKAMLQYISPSGLTRTGKHTIEPSSMLDKLMGYIQGYKKGDTYISFMQSQTKLICQIDQPGHESVRYENPINRSSLIPGSIFSETFLPVAVSAHNNLKPAIYVDASDIYSKNVYLRIADENGMSAPAEFNIEISKECRSVSPNKFSGQFMFMMLCQTPTGPEFRLLPMKE